MVETIYPTLLEKPFQKPINDEVHSWYKIALGYSATLVRYILDKYQVNLNQVVLDPFCGSGTTIVECKKRGITSIGIDANPSSVFASKIKTNWDLDHSAILETIPEIEYRYNSLINNHWNYQSDTTYIYLDNHGMIKRGWISDLPLMKSLSIKQAILSLDVPKRIQDTLMLALISEVVYSASNIKFGPQLYCSTSKTDFDVLSSFNQKVRKISGDILSVKAQKDTPSNIFMGDARDLTSLSSCLGNIAYDFVICSPPYPGEHDYTRHSRLELAFLEEVVDRESLQRIKKTLIRSNTKGIYKEDNDKQWVAENPEIQAIVDVLKERVKTKKHGFARLYPTVVQEYFGGMKRHLTNLFPLLSRGAKCSYVLGDQFSYLQVPIPTAKLLSSIAEEIGYEVDGIEPWKTSWSSKTSKKITENILFFHKP